MSSSPRIKRFDRNTAGRDFVVGDIHGCFTRLQNTLDQLGFDPAVDRLFSVGDLVDRGPECEKVLDWLQKPWFHPIQGNHEDMAIRFAKGNSMDRDNYWQNGGSWLICMPEHERHEYGEALNVLPYAMEIETALGTVGLVHADCPFPSWQEFAQTLESDQWNRNHRNSTLWNRQRIEEGDQSGVEGIKMMVVGHTPVREPVMLGNVLYLDTMGWRPEGYFSIFDLTNLTIDKVW